MLRADRVSFAYRAAAPLVLDEVSLAIAPGELVGILGPNGSGKTTLLKMLGGTLTPSAGEIQFEGRAVRQDVARQRAWRAGGHPRAERLWQDHAAQDARRHADAVGRRDPVRAAAAA